MKDAVDIEIRIDPSCTDPVVVIRTRERTQEVENIIHAVENCVDGEYPRIAGYREGTVCLLGQREIDRVYVESRKVKICTAEGVFESRRSLSFLEQLLNPDRFIRISRFEIVNIRKIANFDFSMAGTVYLRFEDGTVTWAARRYVRSIQQLLGRNKDGEEE